MRGGTKSGSSTGRGRWRRNRHPLHSRSFERSRETVVQRDARVSTSLDTNGGGLAPYQWKWGPAFPPAPTAPSLEIVSVLADLKSLSLRRRFAASLFRGRSGRFRGPSWDAAVALASTLAGFGRRAGIVASGACADGSNVEPKLSAFPVGDDLRSFAWGSAGGGSVRRSRSDHETDGLTTPESDQAESAPNRLWIMGISGVTQRRRSRSQKRVASTAASASPASNPITG